jgi:hypothetical protein
MSATSSTPVAPLRPRRRWLRRLFVTLLILIGLPTAFYFYSSWSLQREIARAIAETDALDPRWRFEDMEADREPVPDAENSALHIINVSRLLGRGKTPSSQKHYAKLFDKLPSTAELNPQQIEMLRSIFEKIPNALAEARKLKDMPRGRFPITRDPSGIVLLPHHHEVHTISDLLLHDAILKAQFGDMDAAVESCLAHANAVRSLHDDPLIISLIIRMHCDTMLVRSVARVLAQGYPKETHLQELQARLRTERDDLARHWITAVRGERAEFHQFFDSLIQGKTTWMQTATNLRVRVGVDDYLWNYLPTLLIKDYPQHLRRRNELVAASRLPMPEQLERFKVPEKKVERWNRYWTALAEVLPLLPPDLTNVCGIQLRGQALLPAAEAGLACERFRIKHQRWPDSLAELVNAKLLDDIPLDPFDGQPLRFKRVKDGIAIYSVGYDNVDDGGVIDRKRPLADGVDVGFHLWDPKHRRQPPWPPVALEN